MRKSLGRNIGITTSGDVHMTTSPAEPSDTTIGRFARAVVSEELEYRREKQWRIFSWVSAVLLAAIGGIVALAGKGDFRFPLSLRILMALALATLAGYACLWIAENIKFETLAREDLTKIDKSLGIAFRIPDPQSRRLFGYGATVLLLALAAVLTVMLAPATGPCPSAA
jgi:hypothetical protein